MELIVSLMIAIGAAVTPIAAPSQGELTSQAVDLFILSDPPCKVADFQFIIRPKMVVATCDTRGGDFAGMFLVDGSWQPGVWDTSR